MSAVKQGRAWTVDAHVLGAVWVDDQGRRVVSGANRVTALFALLATAPGGQCTKEEVVAALWPGGKPTDESIYQVVSRLRRGLGEDVVPRSTSGICAIRMPEGSLDLARFHGGVQRARHLWGREKFEQLCFALRQWDGQEPLRGLTGEVFEARRAQLRRDWLEAVCSRLEAAWHAGEEKWLCEETERLYEQLPDRETIFRFYLVAHGPEMSFAKRSALIRRWMARWGAPGAELRAVFERLRGPAPASRAGMLLPAPYQLPAPPPKMVGRDGLLSSLIDHVKGRQAVGTTAVVLLSGLAGVGKSALASCLALQLRDKFPDGILYGELRGFAGKDVQPTDPEHILDRFLAQLPPQAPVVGLEAKSLALRSALAHRSVLIVLDDAAQADQVLPLLPGPGTCAVIVTSRSTLDDLRASRDVHVAALDPLVHPAAKELLQDGFTPADRQSHTRSLAKLAKLCGHLPLALVVIKSRLEHRPASALPALVRKMEEEKERLRVLHRTDQDLSVLTALSCSAVALSEDARRLLWQLATHPGPSIGWDAVMDLGVVGGGTDADHAVEELATANLVYLHAERYCLHDLVRAFARHEMEVTFPVPRAEFETETVRQVLEHQLHNVHACDRLLNSQRRLPIGEADGVTVADPESAERAMVILDEEYDTTLQCITLAMTLSLNSYIWLLPTTLVTYQWRRRRLRDARHFLKQAMDAAEGHAFPVDRALFYRVLAGTHWRLGEFELAEWALRRAIRLSEQDDSAVGRMSLARCFQVLASTLRKQGQDEEAERYHGKALELYRELSDSVGEAEALTGLGTIYYDRGEYDAALRLCADALGAIDGLSMNGQDHVLNGRADVLYTLGKIHHARGEGNEADRLYEQAASIYRELGHWAYEDKVSWLHADVLVATARTHDAAVVLERVLRLREHMGGAGVQEVRDRLEMLR
ncbi:tetratricopeptide repeat protein [Streptomyces sp. NPDC060131]|uniref:AfsR/SARP family transcriptional regulator n=1 Tax=unclassified Streptomyces TaxID=2593676 RepID=UPI003669B598